MLVYKEPEEEILHKIIGYGTLIIAVFYFFKFIKYISKSRNSEVSSVNSRARVRSSHRSPVRNILNDEKKGRKRQRRKRQHRYATEQWLPRNDPPYDVEDYE
ncbi:unnamed protein product [Danaus chrysippus]|uniref:(African queen) hypothetical protein n=1 Tax=Danaus chrysippus TaxID=151541 RepID=A0A8J2QHY6_9NEOP|nr:unnamed protein product [Danaus chrysippus]